MINRVALGPQAVGFDVYIQVWASVDYIVKEFDARHPDVKFEYCSHGWHENGCKYYEYKVVAATPAKAEEAAEECDLEAQWEWIQQQQK